MNQVRIVTAVVVAIVIASTVVGAQTPTPTLARHALNGSNDSGVAYGTIEVEEESANLAPLNIQLLLADGTKVSGDHWCVSTSGDRRCCLQWNTVRYCWEMSAE